MTRKSGIKKILFITLFTSMGILLLLSCLFLAGLKTETGRGYITSFLEQYLSSPGEYGVKISLITGKFPFDFVIDHVEISDPDGAWLSIKNAHLSWQAAPLLKGKIHINELMAEQVIIIRPPYYPDKKGEDKFKLPEWPAVIPPVHIDRFGLDQILFNEKYLGFNAVFSANGSMITNDPLSGMKGSMEILHTDRPDSFFRVNYSLNGKDLFLILDATLQEKGDGLIKKILGLTDTSSIYATLKGKGPITHWKGRLMVDAGDFFYIETGIEIKDLKDLKFTGAGEIGSENNLFPDEISLFLGGKRVPLDFDLAYLDNNQLIINSVKVSANDSSLAITGSLNFSSRLIDTSFELKIKDLRPFGRLSGTIMTGEAVIKGNVTGPFGQPSGKLHIESLNTGIDNLFVKKIISDIDLYAEGDTPYFAHEINSKGKLRVEGVSWQEKALPLPFNGFHMDFDTRVRKGSPVIVKQLDMKWPDLIITFSGELDPVSGHINGNSSFEASDISRLTGIVGDDIPGSIHLESDFSGHLKPLDLQSKISGSIKDLSPIDSFIVPVTDGEIIFTGNLGLDEGKHLILSDLKVKTGVLDIESDDCNIDLNTRNLDIRATIRSTRPCDLTKALNKRVDCLPELNLEAGGIYPEITGRIWGKMKDIHIEQKTLDQADIFLKAESLFYAPHGNLTLSLKQGEYPLNASSKFSFQEKLLKFTDLSISSFGTDISGNIDLEVDSLIANGIIHGRCNDLSSISPLVHENMAGSVSFDASFSGSGEGQNCTLNLRGNEVFSRFGYIRDILINASVNDLFNRPESVAEIRLKYSESGRLELETIDIKVKGQSDKGNFILTGKGEYLDHFHIRTKGSYSISNDKDILRLELLQGSYGEFPINLEYPLVFSRAYNVYTLKDTMFRFGDSTLQLSGARFAPDEIAIKADLQGLPLTVIQRFGSSGLIGTINAGIAVSGTPGNPECDFQILVDNIQSDRIQYRHIPPADLKIKGSLKNNIFQTNLLFEGLLEKPINANFSVPLAITLSPFSFSPLKNGSIKGAVSAEMKIERITSFFDPEDISLKGDLLMDLMIEGDIEKPVIKGGARLVDGIYENVRDGILIKDIRILAKLERDRFMIEEARATDGEGGRITIDGWLSILPTDKFPFETAIDLNNFAIVRHDKLNVTADGQITAYGTINEPTLAGILKVRHAELQIPDRLPPEIVDLRVIEINQPEELGTEPEPSRKSFLDTTLDLSIEAPGRIFIRGRGLDSEWGGKFSIMGKSREPMLKGSISVLRGRYNFFGKPLTLTSGTISFDGATPPLPDFDVVGENKKSNVTTRVNLSGSASKPTLRIESEPPLPSDEILSRFLFGKGMEEMTPFQALRLAQAIKAVSGNGAGMLDFFNRTQKLMGVDQLDIKQTGDTPGQTSVSVGKYIGEGIYMEVEKGLGDESDKVSIEAEITPDISIESEAGTVSGGGVGINWKFDY